MHEQLTFGRWARERRIIHGLTLPALVQRTGVDSGTISRIENEHAQPTLSTAIRICDGLGESLESLIQALQERKLKNLEPYKHADLNHNGRNVFRPDDVRNFLRFFHENPKKGRDLLVSLLDHIFDDLVKEDNKGANLPRLRPEDIDKLIADSPLFWFELKYPQQIKAKTILAIYKQGGELIPKDVEVYIDEVSHELLNKQINSLSGVLSRIKVASVERVKLSDVMLLDKDLSEQGEILGIYCKVIRFTNEFGSMQEGKLALDLVIISRWLQYLDWENTVWLDHLHHELNPEITSHQTSNRPTRLTLELHPGKDDFPNMPREKRLKAPMPKVDFPKREDVDQSEDPPSK